MRYLWNRLVRTLRQSRIRLPRRALLLQPGDWIQIESGIWRVQSRRTEAGHHRIELETPDGRARAALSTREENEGRWTFRQGTFRWELTEDTLVVFPAGSQAD